VISKGLTVLCDCELDWQDSEHVVQGLNWGGSESATDFAHSNVLGNLKDADYGFWCTVGPHGETV